MEWQEVRLKLAIVLCPKWYCSGHRIHSGLSSGHVMQRSELWNDEMVREASATMKELLILISIYIYHQVYANGTSTQQHSCFTLDLTALPRPTDPKPCIQVSLIVLLQRIQELLRRLLPVPLRVVLRPPPQVLTRILQRPLRLPSQFLIRSRSIRRQVQHIARSSRGDLIRQIASHSMAESLDHVVHRAALTRSQVPGAHTRVLGPQMVESNQVALGEVEDVDVVADRGAVFGGVVVAEDEEFLALADRDLGEEWEEVVGYALWVFTHDAAGMAAGWVEVSEESCVEFFALLACLLCLDSFRVDVVCDHCLDGEFGVAVWVGWAERALFWDWDHVLEAGRVAVDCCRAGEDDVCDIVLLHAPQQAERSVDVDIVVVKWNLGRFTHRLESCEVDDIVDIWVLREDFVKLLLVGNVALVVFGALAGDELDAVEDFVGGVVEVVDDYDLVVCFEEGECGEGANVARAAAKYCLAVAPIGLWEACATVWAVQASGCGTKTYPVTRTDPTTIVPSLVAGICRRGVNSRVVSQPKVHRHVIGGL